GQTAGGLASSREENERVVVAGLSPGRNLRGDDHRARRAPPQHEPPGKKCKPTRSRALRRLLRHDSRSTAEIQRKSRLTDGEGDTAPAAGTFSASALR